jgi:hypothetical protein
VAPDAALRPDRDAQLGAQPLQQDERALLADPAGRLVPLRHDRVRAGRLAGERVLEVRSNQEGACAMSADQLDLPAEVTPSRARQQHGVRRPRRCVEREPQELLVGRDLNAEPAPPLAVQLAQRLERRVAIAGELEIEHAERAGPAGRDRKPRVRATRRGEHGEVQRSETCVLKNGSRSP